MTSNDHSPSQEAEVSGEESILRHTCADGAPDPILTESPAPSGREADIEAQRALAEAMFPREWTAALAITGKRGSQRRANLRRRAVATAKMRELRLAGASCANCANRIRNPHSSDASNRWACDLGSDFHGYQITQLDGLCPDWTVPPSPPLAAQDTADRPALPRETQSIQPPGGLK